MMLLTTWTKYKICSQLDDDAFDDFNRNIIHEDDEVDDTDRNMLQDDDELDDSNRIIVQDDNEFDDFNGTLFTMMTK